MLRGAVGQAIDWVLADLLALLALLWKTEIAAASASGASYAHLAPNAFAQRDFYRQLDFRAERQTFASF